MLDESFGFIEFTGEAEFKRNKAAYGKRTNAFFGSACNLQKTTIPSKGETNKATNSYKINGNLRICVS